MIIKQIMFYSKAKPYMEQLSRIWRSYLNMVKHKPYKEVPQTMLMRHVPNRGAQNHANEVKLLNKVLISIRLTPSGEETVTLLAQNLPF